MKKTALILTVLFAVVMLISSCRTHELCPAYGKQIKSTAEKQS